MSQISASFLMGQDPNRTFCGELEAECRERGLDGVFLFDYNDDNVVVNFKMLVFHFCFYNHLTSGENDSYNFF